MIENILTAKNFTVKGKLTVKGCISFALVFLAVALPQLVHIALGQSGGVKWLPMYLPVLFGGCLLGIKWGLGIAIASPLCSFVFTSLFLENPMPAAARLPFMIAELAVFAAVSGAFGKKIYHNGLWAIPAVLLAEVCGRASFLLLVTIFQSVSSLTPQMVWGQIQTGLLGVAVQVIFVPVVVILLRKLLKNERR